MVVPGSSRIFPLQKPLDHSPPIPRWQLVFPPEVTHVWPAYIGVQVRTCQNQANAQAKDEAEAGIESWISDQSTTGSLIAERFTCIRGRRH